MSEWPARARVIEHRGAEIEILLERRIGHDPAAVWHMLTHPAALPKWLGPGAVEPRTGGRARIDFDDSGATIDSRVQACDPERLLVYAWGGETAPHRPLYWALVPMDGGTQLRLSLRMPAHEDGAKAAAGWDAHLEMLLAALDDVPIRFPLDHFRAMRAWFREQLAAAPGGKVPA